MSKAKRKRPFNLALLRDDIAQWLADLHERLFVDEMRLTLVARKPGNVECELVVSDDDLAEVMAVVERSQWREAVK